MMKTTKNNLNELIQVLKENPAVDFILPSDPRYATARLIYNRMHDGHPGLIVRTLDVEVLRTIVAFVARENIVLAIRGGGHHIGGFSTCNDGIVIDFSPFKDIHIDVAKNIASVGPGACLNDIDRELSARGFIVPTGSISETGLAGLTLGGGVGWLIGKYGLTCDQLCGADVLLANGELVKAEEHKDLLWALRGGGGNFGIVLNFRYHLNPLPKTICGMGEVTFDNAAKVLDDLNKYLMHCPASITVAPVFIKVKSKKPMFRIDFCCADGTAKELADLLNFSNLVTWSSVREWEFAAWQCQFDYILLPPKRGYWKAAYIENLNTDIIASICHSIENSPDWECTILIEHLHGAFKNYDQSTAAFPLRHTNMGVLFSSRWEDKADDDTSIHWVRDSFSKIDPEGLTATYSNYTSADDDRASQTLQANTKSKIANVKARYDPENIFKRNHNVRPTIKKLVTA